jgi:hypothetical protein
MKELTATENAATFTEAQVAVVLQMDEEDFEELVLAQLRLSTRDAAAWSLLVSPSVILRTKNTLDRTRMRVQGTLVDKKLELAEFQNQCHAMPHGGKQRWYEGRIEMMRSQRASSNFLGFVESAQKDVRVLIKQQSDAHYEASRSRGDRRRNGLDALHELVAAIVSHETAQSHDGTDEDEKLWDLLDSIEVGGDGTTLREAHESGWTH